MRFSSSKSWSLAFVGMALACSDKGQVRSEEGSHDLATRIWDIMLSAESDTAYHEPLSSDLLARHKAGIRAISEKIPENYPEPYLPYGMLDNKALDPGLAREPLIDHGKIELGRKLFNDKTLSYSEAHPFSAESGISCASCHIESREFTDNLSLSVGITGERTHRNTPTLWNSVYSSTLTWSNASFPILEMQAKIPLFNDDPIEMGLRGKEKDLLLKLSGIPEYVEGFKHDYDFDLNLFSTDYTIVTSALAAYERSLIRFDGPFDKFLQGKSRMPAKAEIGARLFYGILSLEDGSTLACAQCHSGILMSDSFQYVRNGAYWNQVIFHKTIRTPQLRFVSKTAPYFHDGSQSTLDGVLDFYSRGGRDDVVQPSFTLNASEREALRAFFDAI